MKKALSFLVAVCMAFVVHAQNDFTVRLLPEIPALSSVGTATLYIAYETDSTSLPIAYQMDVILPKGFAPADVDGNVQYAASLDNTDKVYPTAFVESKTPVHQLTCSWKADKQLLRLLCFSMSNSTFKCSKGRLLKIKLKTDGSEIAQEAEAVIKNVTFVMQDMQKGGTPDVKIRIPTKAE